MAPKSKNAKKQPNPKSSLPSTQDAGPKPNWPPLKPLLPTSDLAFETLLSDQILTIPRLWTSTLCKSYVSFLSSLSLTTTPGKPKKGDAVRVNDRFQVNDAAFAEQLWSGTALKDLVTGYAVDGVPLNDGEVLGLNSNIRVYRYSKGQFFDQHCKFIAEIPTYLVNVSLIFCRR